MPKAGAAQRRWNGSVGPRGHRQERRAVIEARLAAPLCAEHVVLDARGREVARVVGIEGALHAAKLVHEASYIIGLCGAAPPRLLAWHDRVVGGKASRTRAQAAIARWVRAKQAPAVPGGDVGMLPAASRAVPVAALGTAGG